MAKLDLANFPYGVLKPYFDMQLWRMANLDHSRVKLCVWHHSGSRTDRDSTAASINNFHMRPVDEDGRGWAGIAYHGWIRFNGQLELGRPLHKQGVHASQVNAVSLGFCMSGNFEIANIWDRPDQFWSGVALAKVVNKLFPNITHVRHMDVGRTQCNGKYFPWAQFIEEIYKEEGDGKMAKHVFVQRGDRLFNIAFAHDVSREDILKFNKHISDPDLILAEYGGDIVFLSQPNALEIQAAQTRRDYILLRDFSAGLEVKNEALEQLVKEEAQKANEAVVQANKYHQAGKAMINAGRIFME